MTRRKRTRTEVAESLAATGMIRDIIGWTINRCRATGLDEQSFTALHDVGNALSDTFKVRGRSRSPWRSDRAYVNHLVEVEVLLVARLANIDLRLEIWEQEAAEAQDMLAILPYTLSTLAQRTYWQAVLESAVQALGIAEEARDKVWTALCCLRDLYDQLEDTYQAAYDLVRSGRVLPHNGRWITGEPLSPAARGYRVAVRAVRNYSKAR